MKKNINILLLLLIANTILAQELPIQTFGNKNDKAILFLHGGPGYNSVTFEQTTADVLAKNGFFVMSYDRRGEGRNNNLIAEYTFIQTIKDINLILEKYNIEKVTLVGHSFGGIVGTLYATKHPDKIHALILASAPISMQKTLKNIIEKSKAIYLEKKDSVNLNYISMLEKMDSASLPYSSYTFMHAMSNGFYSTKSPNKKAIELYKSFQTDSLLNKYASKMEYKAPQKFWENEQYTSITLKGKLEEIKNSDIMIYGIYGEEDGLFSTEQIDEIRHSIGSENLIYLENCSHSVFMDRQETFIDSLKDWLK